MVNNSKPPKALMTTLARAANHAEASDAVMKRAEETLANLGAKFPTFVKCLIHSHVAGHYPAISVPTFFCRLHMLGYEGEVTLVNEHGQEYEVNYVRSSKLLTVGWKWFSADNKLCVGDLLAFQLIELFKFKVYIIRTNDLAGAASTNASTPNTDSDAVQKLCKTLPEQIPEENIKQMVSDSNLDDDTNASTQKTHFTNKSCKSLPGHTAEENIIHVISDSDLDDRANASTQKMGPAQKLCKTLAVHILEENTEQMVSDSNLEDDTNAGTQKTNSANKSCKSLPGHTAEENIKHVVSDSDLDDRANASTQKMGPAKKLCKTLAVHIPEENTEQMVPDYKIDTSRSNNYCKDFIIYTKEDVISSRCSFDFKEVKSIEDFSIVINGLNIDAVVSEEIRTAYYELCCSQKSYLHDGILKDVKNSMWAASIISQIVNIANAIRTCKLSTPQSDYTSWNKILYSFEVLGMNVEFLRARLRRLGRLSVDAKDTEIFSTQIVEARQELLDNEEKITALELEASKLKRKNKEVAAGMKAKKAFIDKCEHNFEEEVNSPLK